jgi:hypothetical protein
MLVLKVRAHAMINQVTGIGPDRVDDASVRYDRGHIITPPGAKDMMGYHKMDLFVPIVYRGRRR